MFDLKHPSKIQSVKNQRWRLELTSYDSIAIYQARIHNRAPNTLFIATGYPDPCFCQRFIH